MSYADTAASIYDPALQAEQASLTNERDTEQLGLKQEQATVNPYYDSAEKTLAKTRASEGQMADFNYNEAGIYESGLRTNAQNALGTELIDKTKELETERTQKLSSIADRTTLSNTKYATGSSALVSKYQGLKNQYITDAAEKDRQIQIQQDQFDKQLAATYAQIAASKQIASTYATAGQSSAPAKVDYNSQGVTQWIATLEKQYAAGRYPGAQSWGSVAKAIEASTGTKIPTGSNLDVALHKIYT